ncbi:MAG: PilZ domain-containing protein [Proteobacteria bacterium]|nr:PilZ domain-containing protein [Pseudomonadota bacterium]MBU1584295.1 PilZ domain-containing protein [Pseudomonadota bacterium]MBU2628168.1 PilZ domain-containing protein [Pseudomonadota bacterium]
MVFNMNSLAPYSRSSIIYDVDFKKNEIIIAQPLIPFSKDTSFKELDLTTIIQDKNRRIRVGIKCCRYKMIDRYALANKTIVSAVLLTYELPVKETNIRSAFRLPVNTKYIIKGKLLYGNLEYFTPRDFSIRDISLTGLGLVIPKKRNKNLNSLLELKINEEIMVGIILVNVSQNKPVGTLPVKTQIIRINSNYSDTHSLVGLKILNLGKEKETILNGFIHDAQIDELKRLSGRNL